MLPIVVQHHHNHSGTRMKQMASWMANLHKASHLHVVAIACNDSYVGLGMVIGFCGKLSRLLKGSI